MKILKSFILVSLLVCTGGAAFACGPWYYSASDNRLYRIVPPLWKAPLSDDFTTKNIILWSRQTHFRDTAAIRRAVYTEWDKFVNWEELLWEMQNSAAAPYNPLSADNKFCAHLVERQDTDAVRLLYWSKMYSNIRTSQRSPWYYNSRIETDETKQLREMYEEVQKYKPAQKYADRYTFLAIKCLWALGEDSSMVALWEREKKHLKKSIFYEEAGDYAARCLTRMGRQAEADAIYRHNKNIVELMPAGIKLPEQLRIMLRVCPNSPQLIPILQDFLSEIDQEQARTYRWYEYETKSEAKKVLSVACEAIDNPNVKSKAMWRYTAACILDYLGKPSEALPLLDGAENGDGKAFLRNSVRILTLHLRAQTDTIDDAFVQYTTNEVQWLDGEMQREWRKLPDSVQNAIKQVHSWVWYRDLKKMYSYGVLRRIFLADSVGLAFRMADAGYEIRALQIANVADNWLLKFSGNKVIDSCRNCDRWEWHHWGWEKENGKWNYHDYSNGIFALADKMSASTLEEYRGRMLRPKDKTDRWFNARSYTNGDYWQDIIGTHYLRERNYHSAIAHLKYVSPSYQRRMNLRCYIDPFSIDRSIVSHDSTHYKLHFAQRMDSLQHAMFYDRDADHRGMAMLEYTIGLENSFDMCWWLTSYQKGWTWSGPFLTDIDQTEYAHKAQAVVKQLRRKALNMLRTDETRAKYHLRLGQYSIVKRKYLRTNTGQQIALACDAGWQYRTCIPMLYK